MFSAVVAFVAMYTISLNAYYIDISLMYQAKHIQKI